MRAAYLAGLTLAATLVASACRRPAAVPLPDLEQPLALLARPTLAGPPLDPRVYAGKVVVVNVWSPSCVPCAHEAPGLQQVADELAPRGLALVTVMMEGSAADARAFVDRARLTAPVVVGDATIMSHYGVLAYPWTVVVGRDGRPLRAVRGSREPAQLRELLSSYL